MPSADPCLLVLCTCPDQAAAQNIAGHLVDDRLAACVNILPGLTSVYRWQGTRETAEEHLLLIKTTQAGYRRVEASIMTHHPYELPEIIAVPINLGLPNYLGWIQESVNGQ